MERGRCDSDVMVDEDKDQLAATIDATTRIREGDRLGVRRLLLPAWGLRGKSGRVGVGYGK